MKYTIDWTLRHRNGYDVVMPLLGEQVTMAEDFYAAVFKRFWPWTAVNTIPDTALAKAIATGEKAVVDVDSQPDYGLHVTRTTATPMGNGVFRVEYEVEND